jgi:hypothetical protein
VSTQAPARSQESLQKEWWLRVLVVLQHPRSVFEAMRDDADDAASARQEPALALVFLGGIAAVLSFSSTSGEFLDDPSVDGILIAVLTFLAGGIYGFAAYWLGGGGLYLGVRGARGEGSYRQARHILAYSLAPLALSLVLVWPIRIAVYGSDNFRTGGADEGAGYWVFTGISYAFALWSIALVWMGVRHVHGWTAIRSIGALLLMAMALLGLALLALSIGGGL